MFIPSLCIVKELKDQKYFLFQFAHTARTHCYFYTSCTFLKTNHKRLHLRIDVTDYISLLKSPCVTNLRKRNKTIACYLSQKTHRRVKRSPELLRRKTRVDLPEQDLRLKYIHGANELDQREASLLQM